MGQEQKDRQNAWGRTHGLQSTNAEEMCPRRILRRQCLLGAVRNRMIAGENVWCVCQHSKVRALSDHARRWRLGKEMVLTYEPYHVDLQALNDLRTVMLDMGIYVWETGESAWEDGTSILILARIEVTAQELGL